MAVLLCIQVALLIVVAPSVGSHISQRVVRPYSSELEITEAPPQQSISSSVLESRLSVATWEKLRKEYQKTNAMMFEKNVQGKTCRPGTKLCHIPGSSLPTEECIKADVLLPNPKFYNAAAYRPWHSNKGALEVHTLPIGQGDCTVIYCPSGKNAVLFDCGSTSGGKNRFSPAQVSRYFDRVEHITIIISHGDLDHYNYLPHIFKDIYFDKITKVILGGPERDYSSTRSGIVSWRKYLHASAKDVISTGPYNPYLGNKDLCDDPTIHFEVIAAGLPGTKNERSVVMKLSRDNSPSSLLFSGDMEGSVALQLAKDAETRSKLRSTHYKIAHHGASSRANYGAWLAAISPIEAHVSHAYIGRYGHPRCETISRLMNVGSVGTTDTHTFACVKSKMRGKPPEVDRGDICHRIFSTSPSEDTICVIKLSLLPHHPAATEYYCGRVENWTV